MNWCLQSISKWHLPDAEGTFKGCASLFILCVWAQASSRPWQTLLLAPWATVRTWAGKTCSRSARGRASGPTTIGIESYYMCPNSNVVSSHIVIGENDCFWMRHDISQKQIICFKLDWFWRKGFANPWLLVIYNDLTPETQFGHRVQWNTLRWHTLVWAIVASHQLLFLTHTNRHHRSLVALHRAQQDESLLVDWSGAPVILLPRQGGDHAVPGPREGTREPVDEDLPTSCAEKDHSEGYRCWSARGGRTGVWPSRMMKTTLRLKQLPLVQT